VTLPVVKAGKLAGLLKEYNTKSQTISVIPGPVIDHFLKDLEDGNYQGFPLLGFAMASAEDPQLRQFEGLEKEDGGVYVDRVLPDSPAGQAGLKPGDILLKIGPHAIDARGQIDDPVYGAMGVVHLRCQYQVGETAELSVLRSGKPLSIPVTFEHRDAQDHLIPPYLVDQPPRYFILGGLILQELTGDHLIEQQNQKAGRRPWRLLYLYRYPERFNKGELKKIVFLSDVIPTSYTVGYEDLVDLIVTRINHQTIRDLSDVPVALQHPIGRFHKVEFDQPPYTIYFHTEQLAEIHRQIQQRYRVPALTNLSPR
jgi:hypothetical protein